MLDTTTASIAQSQNELDGQVIMPDDASYDDARTVFYGGIDRRPAAIVRAASADDVRQRSRSHESRDRVRDPQRWPQHPRPTARPRVGRVDLRDLNELKIDVENRTAWVGGGVTTGRYTEAPQSTVWRRRSATPARSGSAGRRSAEESASSSASTISRSTTCSPRTS